MKHLVLVVVAAICFAACQNADKQSNEKALSPEQRRNALNDSSKFTTIQWVDSTYRDLGKAKEGEKVEVNYRFKNTGNHNLILSDVQPSCGCTTPEWPKQPIAPGEEGVIKAVFNSEHRVGENMKQITVMANTNPQTTMMLSFRVNVTPNQ
jgi:hypothetical protein